MRNLKIIILLHLILFVSSCGTVKEAFTNQKKNSSDEFLVEKKSPLVMPPDYNELPNPKLESEPKTFEENSNIKELIVNSDQNNNSSPEKDKSSENFEKLFLEKIKKN